MEEIYLKDIKHEYNKDERVCDWEFIECKDSSVRVYYKSNKEIGLGFRFYAVENLGCASVPETENNEWHPEYACVECVYQGVAYFDGIRHLYMGANETNNFGYHYYANLETNIEALKVIRELEKKYCRDLD